MSERGDASSRVVRQVVERLIAILRRVSWPALAFYFALIYGVGAVVILSQEPPDSALSSLSSYSWWFLVTITTVGYGDLVPMSGIGRIAAMGVMILGIGALGVAFGKLGELYISIGRKGTRGMVDLDVQRHIVIFGYRAGETERMVQEILADTSGPDRAIVLCSETAPENPLPEQVLFVRGDMTSDDVLERACVAAADLVVIHRADDAQTVLTALAVSSQNDTAHVVAHLRDPEHEKHLKRIGPHIECVYSVSVPLIVQALQDPGTTRVVQSLLSNVEGDVLYRFEVPADSPERSFQETLARLLERHRAIVIGLADSAAPAAKIQINPGGEAVVRGGMSIFYIAGERLSETDWAAL